MKLKSSNKWNPARSFETTLSAVVEHAVDGSDYDTGKLEALENTVRNQSVLLAVVIEHMNPSAEWLNAHLADYDEILEKLP
jgi:hypothetical protein